MVGDIEYNKEIDKENFNLCFEKHIFQYFNNSGGVEYVGEKLAIEKEFFSKYKSENLKGETTCIIKQEKSQGKGLTDVREMVRQ